MVNNEVITSRNNPLVKLAASLAEKKGRREAQAFMAEGVKLTLEAISERMPITHILINEEDKGNILPRIKRAIADAGMEEPAIYILADSAFAKISTEKAPQGVITIIKSLDISFNADIIYKEEFFLDVSERAIVLCSVRDPLNLGAVIRSAVAFGVKHIVLSSDCADVYSPKTIRSAMGGIFKVKITVVPDFSGFISTAKNYGRSVYAAELSASAVSLNDVKLSATDLIVIGNEGHGIPEEISKLCTGSIYIPIRGGVESLNASVAAAIFIWEQSKT